MSWITTKLLAYALGGMTLIAVALGGVAAWNYKSAQAADDRAALAEAGLESAKAANIASTAMVASLQAERDAFVLKRAMELKQAQEIVARSEYESAQMAQLLVAANKRIKALSRQADCRTAMEMPICPGIVDELRAP